MEEKVIDLYDMFIDLYWNDISSNDRDWEIEGKLWSILNEIYFKYGYQDRVIFSLSLYGSQNYNMDNENSDIDCQCFFFPTAEEIIFKILLSICFTLINPFKLMLHEHLLQLYTQIVFYLLIQ